MNYNNHRTPLRFRAHAKQKERKEKEGDGHQLAADDQ